MGEEHSQFVRGETHSFYFKQHSGRYSQIGKKLDGVEHKQYPAAWDTYVPKPVYKSIGLPSQIAVFNVEDYL